MPVIRPITDLRNTNEISEICHKQQQPVFITKKWLWRFSSYEYGKKLMKNYSAQIRLIRQFLKQNGKSQKVQNY